LNLQNAGLGYFRVRVGFMWPDAVWDALTISMEGEKGEHDEESTNLVLGTACAFHWYSVVLASWSSVSNRQYPNKHLRLGSSSCSPRCSCRSCAKDGNGRWLKTLVSAVKT